MWQIPKIIITNSPHANLSLPPLPTTFFRALPRSSSQPRSETHFIAIACLAYHQTKSKSHPKAKDFDQTFSRSGATPNASVLKVMAPPLEPFLPADLQWRAQIQANGKGRKQPIELEKCALKEIVQYDCQVQYKDKNDKIGTIVCTPVTRLFRRYVFEIAEPCLLPWR